MSKRCTVQFCKSKLGAGVTFHRFPQSNSNLLEKWLNQLGRQIEQIGVSSRICSIHFEDSCFDRTGQVVRLKPDAYPTVNLRLDSDNKSKLEESDTPKRPKPKVCRKLLSEYDVDLTAMKRNVIHDHTYGPVEDTTDYKKMYLLMKKKYATAQKKIKVLQCKIRRQKKKIEKFPDLINNLKEQQLITEHANHLLHNTLDGAPEELFQRCMNATSTHTKYPPELRKFALTLNFLSNKAYEYVRNTFNNALPHRSTLSKWYCHVSGDPGISEEAFVTIEKRMKEEGERPIVSLVFDEMSIRKNIEFDGTKNWGFIDFGYDMDSETLPAATQALVYMVVAVNSGWKVPVAYFFINSLTADEKVSVLLTVLEKIHSIGLPVISVTCDGPAANINMARLLGVSFDINNFNTAFKNPFTSNLVYFILDLCHAIKLMRNFLFDVESFFDGDGNEINVCFIIKLHELQEKIQLRFANKLTSEHIAWKKQPMKVRLAIQTLSASVADAIDYCRDVLKLPEFEHSEATTNFIRKCDRLFDILNSRNIFGKNYKAPLKLSNEKVWRPFLNECFEYFSKMRLKNGSLVVHSSRKVPFLGFLCLIRSTQGIFDAIIKNNFGQYPSTEQTETEQKVKYLLMYKFSQDHLELFFSSIRSRGGFNNNPSAKQFAASYKRLLIHHELKHSNTNCLALDNTNILSVSSSVSRPSASNGLDNEQRSTVANRYPLFDTVEITDHDYAQCTLSLPNYVEDIVTYISGYVVRKTLKVIKCVKCAEALTSDAVDNSFINFKNRGGLIRPSKDVELICKQAEKLCTRLLHSTNNQPPAVENILQFMTNSVFSNLPANTFDCLKDHLFELEIFGNNHVVLLSKHLISTYLRIRLHHVNKLFNLKLKGDSLRQHLTKTILFRNQ